MSSNQLLDRFPAKDRALLNKEVRPTAMAVGEVVYEPGQTIRHIHFPISGLLSAVVVLRNGTLVEAAAIGREGVAGLEALIEGGSSPYRVVQQVPGEVFQLPAEVLREVATESPQVRQILGRYVLALAQQYAQGAACNLHHRVEERMCRWLLSTADRVGREGFGITQEFLSVMLGVSRQSVSLTAGQLQEAGLIAYRRGNLRIIDRAGLEQTACECYHATKDAYNRLMRTSAA